MIPWRRTRQPLPHTSWALPQMMATAVSSVSCFEYNNPSFAPQPCQLGPLKSPLFRLPIHPPPASAPAAAAAAVAGRGGRGRRKGGGGRGGGRSRCDGGGWGLRWWGVALPLGLLALVLVQALLIAQPRPLFLFLSLSLSLPPYKAYVCVKTLWFLSLESLYLFLGFLILGRVAESAAATSTWSPSCGPGPFFFHFYFLGKMARKVTSTVLLLQWSLLPIK